MTGVAGERISAQQLRQDFDATFATPLVDREERDALFLTLSIAGDGYALRASELSGFVAGRKILGLSGALPELLGLAGMRGVLVPVYSIAALIGYQESAEAPRWIAISAGVDPVGLAFASFEGHRELPRSALHPAIEATATLLHITEVFRTERETRGVISVESLVQRIRSRVSAAAAAEEGSR